MATIYGTSGADTRNGTDQADTIYGYAEATPPSSVIASGLYRPLFATAPERDKDRLFVVSQGGTIKIHDLTNPQAQPKTFLDLGGVVNNNTEAGLIGFTFHPDFANNGKCYVNYTTPDQPDGSGRNQAIVEYTFNPNDISAPPTAKTIMVIDYPQEHSHHRGGWIGFGPDSMLYIATGEDTVATNAQTVVNQDGSINHLGKILRIDVRGDDFPADVNRNYSIPDDPLTGNPTKFHNIDGVLDQPSEIWAVGLRNPWRASFGPDGKLYVADVGQNTYEEINIVEGGKNYGWRPAPVGDGPQNIPGYTDPYYYYGRDVGGSVTGGYFYEGPGSLNGKYIFGDFNSGRIFAMDVSGATPNVQDITDLFKDAQGNTFDFGHISSFGVDGQGNLYAISYADDTWGNDTGRVFRLTDNTPLPDEGDTLTGAGGNNTIYGGGGNDTIHGGDDNDHLYGDADNDRLYGDAGADTLEGGAGSDVYYVDAEDTIVEAANGGNDNVHVRASFVLQAGQHIEQIQVDLNDPSVSVDLSGNQFMQVLIGHAGNNRLDGKGGADAMMGGAGNDTYVVDNAGDIITEDVDTGTDTVESTIDFSFYSDDDPEQYINFENLTLLGNAIRATGNMRENDITGNDQANLLDGKGGMDTLRGGDGNDTYWVYGNGEVIEETAGKGTDTIIVRTFAYALADGIDVEVLKAHEDNEVSDLTGNNLNNVIHGNKGANRIDGGGGTDTVVFTGKRTDYTITRNQDGSFTLEDTRANGDGSDTVLGAETFRFSDGLVTAGNLLNTAPTGITLDKDAVDENSKRDTLIGRFKVTDADDTQHRFELIDTAGGRFAIDSTSGVLTVADGVRLDHEQATQHSITVKATDGAGASVTRTLFITVVDVLNESATGDALGNLILGGAGKDIFSGGVGNDTLNAGASHDRLSGDAGNDSLVGGAGNDVLSGGDGNDRLVGGTGKDTFTGGKGRDVFVFDDREAGSSKTKADTITDFKGREGDRIDLKLVDANTKKSGDQKFSFIGKEAFSKAGQVRYEKMKKETYVYLNTDSDKAAEAVIKLKGAIDLSKSWFVL